MLQLLLHAEKIHVSVVNFRFHVMPCSMVWSGEAAEVQRLVDALALGGVDRKEFLTLHHRAVFRLYYQRSVNLSHFRGCVCTHAFLLRLIASDRSMSCQKFCKSKGRGIVFADEANELNVLSACAILSAFSQGVMLLDGGQSMRPAGQSNLQLDSEPVSTNPQELLATTCRFAWDVHKLYFEIACHNGISEDCERLFHYYKERFVVITRAHMSPWCTKETSQERCESLGLQFLHFFGIMV